jgi:hypothetical protein
VFHSVIDPRAACPRPPFATGGPFPELGPDRGCDPDNRLSGPVRGRLRRAGYDGDRFGSPDWNPFVPDRWRQLPTPVAGDS